MIASYGIIYQYVPPISTPAEKLIDPGFFILEPDINIAKPRTRSGSLHRAAGVTLLLVSAIGIAIPVVPHITLETGYQVSRMRAAVDMAINPPRQLPPAAPVLFNPLVQANGTIIRPIDHDFSIIVPKIGINAKVIPSVNPLKPAEYIKALEEGVAHASSSYFPDQEGTVYLFSHSTNYEWYVKDLNAVFYNIKNLEAGDFVVLVYKDKRYTYKYTQQKVVSPNDNTYLEPQSRGKHLILQTCWPPGSTEKRLLLFADLVDEHGQAI